MSLVRVQFFSISLDGFGTGDVQSLDAPFGHAGERLHEWMFVTRWWHQTIGEPGGTAGIDDTFVRLHDPGVGAEIMGAGKFGLHAFPDDPDWKGWWGDEPPFGMPVYVLTHTAPRPSIPMQGGTTFHFRSTEIEDVLAEATAAAGGLDVRVGGGVSTARDFLRAGLVDHLHVAIAPILLGRGNRFWDDLAGLELTHKVTTEVAESGTIHVTLTR